MIRRSLFHRCLAALAYPAVVLLAAAVLVGCAACAAVSVGWEEFARRVGAAGDRRAARR
jgi:ACR3 family arsenite efflux pump ArsB